MARSGGPIGVANLVPGAGLTHALSGVGEAYMDNVPMLVLVCGIRRDTGHRYQLHDIDQLAMIAPVCKGTFLVEQGSELPAVILEAIALAQEGCPGPVAVEVPCDHYLFKHDFDPAKLTLSGPWARAMKNSVDPAQVQAAAQALLKSKQPLIHLGLGASSAADLFLEIAERLGAVVSTTISGKGVFPENHPQWLWPGFGSACPKPLQKIAAGCDAALVVGARMGEVSTASYGLTLPQPAVQVDIEPDVLGANFPVWLGIEADARVFAQALLEEITHEPFADATGLKQQLLVAHGEVRRHQAKVSDKSRVSPNRLMTAVQRIFPPSTCYTTDSGKGTFLAMEHLRLNEPRRMLSPTDFSCMGYSVPAAIGACLAQPGEPVVAFAGDGALLMTGLELITAGQLGLPLVVFVLSDGELGQIARFQRDITTSPTCTVLPGYNIQALSMVAHLPYRYIGDDADVDAVVQSAFELASEGTPVVVEVNIDYSEKTFFTKGVVKTNFGRLPWRERTRMVSRLVGRKLGALAS
jgi:acetolactate synthase-1/2/3 large subunit